jgi:hypothetical protein
VALPLLLCRGCAYAVLRGGLRPPLASSRPQKRFCPPRCVFSGAAPGAPYVSPAAACAAPSGRNRGTPPAPPCGGVPPVAFFWHDPRPPTGLSRAD